MKHHFACLMFLVWTQSLEDRRRTLWEAEAIREGQWTGLDLADWDKVVERKEARVNRALVARNKWKKRACENCRSKVQRWAS